MGSNSKTKLTRPRTASGYRILCERCQEGLGETSYQTSCPRCGGALGFKYSRELKDGRLCEASMWRYRALLPVRPDAEIVTLGEGLTPLQRSKSAAHEAIYLKNECLNPTGSHKDRSLSIGLTKAREFGFDTVMLYSDGSAALSSAAYAARAQCRNITVLPADAADYRAVPLAFYNSIILKYTGPNAEALTWVNRACRTLGLFETTTYRLANPYQAEGPKTIGLEIFEQLGRVPDWIVVPLGGGGTLTGIWRAFVDLQESGRASKLPHMVGVLAAGYTRLALALERHVTSQEALSQLPAPDPPLTILAKIAMTDPPDGIAALEAIRESSGRLLFATDPEAIEAQRTLGGAEGIFAEPSASASWVGVEKLLAGREVGKDHSVVAVITGSGFREMQTVSGHLEHSITTVNEKSGLSTLQRILESQDTASSRGRGPSKTSAVGTGQ